MPLPPPSSNYKTKKQIEQFLRNAGIQAVQQVPRDVWIQLIRNNPQLTVLDIQMMCSVNQSFRKLCEDKRNSIWDALLRDEFGNYPSINKLIKKFPNYTGMQRMYRLMAFRIMKKTPLIQNEFYYYALGKDEKNFAYIKHGELRADESPLNAPVVWTRATHLFIVSDSRVKLNRITTATRDMLLKSKQKIPISVNALRGGFEVGMWLDDEGLNSDFINVEDDDIFAVDLVTRNNKTVDTMHLIRILFYLMQKGYLPLDMTASYAMTKQKVCANCSAVDTELLLCGACKTTYYCSAECQAKNWNSHKLKCNLF